MMLGTDLGRVLASSQLDLSPSPASVKADTASSYILVGIVSLIQQPFCMEMKSVVAPLEQPTLVWIFNVTNLGASLSYSVLHAK